MFVLFLNIRFWFQLFYNADIFVVVVSLRVFNNFFFVLILLGILFFLSGHADNWAKKCLFFSYLSKCPFKAVKHKRDKTAFSIGTFKHTEINAPQYQKTTTEQLDFLSWQSTKSFNCLLTQAIVFKKMKYSKYPIFF